MTGSWTAPRTAVVAEVECVLDGDRDAVLATVVDVEGSAYRRPGAKMVVDDAGGTGTITVGCLEPELQSLASTVVETGQHRLETYDLRAGEDDVWGLGVGCNGVIHVLLEPITAPLRPLVDAHEDGRPAVTVTVIDTDREDVPQFARTSVVDGETTGTALPPAVSDALAPHVETAATDGRSDVVTVDTAEGSVRAFVDGVSPPPRLVVCGSGHDVEPVVTLAHRNGFRVQVAAFRDIDGLDDRLPDAAEVRTMPPAAVADQYAIDETTSAVVMSHNFVDDGLAIDALLDAGATYVGLLGPTERFEKIETEFRTDSGFTDAERARIYTPAGLDLGAGSPWGIATSIVSELLTVHNDRTPQHLLTRPGPIHDRDPDPGTTVDASTNATDDGPADTG